MIDQQRNARLNALVVQTRALMRAIEQAGAAHNQEFGRYMGFKHFARRYNLLAQQAMPFLQTTVIVNTFNVDDMSDPNDLTWPMAKNIFDAVYAETALIHAALEGQHDFAEAKNIELKSFFEASLRRAVFKTPQSEREVQDIVEQLLIGRGFNKGVDYDRETGRVKYAGKEFVPDFIFVPADMFIEVKLVKNTDRAKTVVEEINADLVAYKTRYARGIFVIYDLGVIRDVSEFAHSIEQNMDVFVCVIKH
jgi:hypothetical protein